MQATKLQKSLPSQTTLTQEQIGKDVSMTSEINKNVDHAGLSLPLKLYQTDSVLHQIRELTLFSPHKTWYPATIGIWDAMVVSSMMLGGILNTLV